MLKSAFVAAVLAIASIAPVTAADYPAKPVKVIVPYAAAGPTDFFARYLAKGLTEALKTSTVVDNLPGAGGNIGMQAAQRAASDGYTLAFISAAQAVNMTLYNNPGYDLEKFTLVALVGVVPNVFLIQSSVGIRTMPEMLDYARKNPGKLEYGSGGFGGSGHLSGAMLEKMAGAKLTYVNYKGGGPAHVDFMGGHIRMMVSDVPGAHQHLATGRAVALGVTSATRSELLPQVPAVAEFVPGYQSVGWYALLAPSATPPAVITRLRQESEKILGTAEHKAKLLELGASRPSLSDAQKDSYLSAEISRWGSVIKEAGVAKLD